MGRVVRASRLRLAIGRCIGREGLCVLCQRRSFLLLPSPSGGGTNLKLAAPDDNFKALKC
ncbi:hypothetical protein B7H23_05920 [Notoacmeibacter marinus]|uniref:Uncharacterized protein n=1 Tax=Notoacmeibacter marinus TaxID=1876515 RepID=A0A231V2M6_9HYPH|nr:hypothetical protein B7H23_05920 [Notoacmeibacter marinus]